tara:strand:+ start:1586 stop:2107 length:522 start_codon:yes stop_codon:yes gene_type:complete
MADMKKIEEQIKLGVLKKLPNPDCRPCVDGTPRVAFYRCLLCNTGGLGGMNITALPHHMTIDKHKKNLKMHLHERGLKMQPDAIEKLSKEVAKQKETINRERNKVWDANKIIEDLNCKLAMREDTCEKLNQRVEQLEGELEEWEEGKSDNDQIKRLSDQIKTLKDMIHTLTSP